MYRDYIPANAMTKYYLKMHISGEKQPSREYGHTRILGIDKSKEITLEQ